MLRFVREKGAPSVLVGMEAERVKKKGKPFDYAALVNPGDIQRALMECSTLMFSEVTDGRNLICFSVGWEKEVAE